jgi:hypothetical protein
MAIQFPPNSGPTVRDILEMRPDIWVNFDGTPCNCASCKRARERRVIIPNNPIDLLGPRIGKPLPPNKAPIDPSAKRDLIAQRDREINGPDDPYPRTPFDPFGKDFVMNSKKVDYAQQDRKDDSPLQRATHMPNCWGQS